MCSNNGTESGSNTERFSDHTLVTCFEILVPFGSTKGPKFFTKRDTHCEVEMSTAHYVELRALAQVDVEHINDLSWENLLHGVVGHL